MAHFESRPEADKNRSLARWIGAGLLGGVLIVTPVVRAAALELHHALEAFALAER